VTGEVQSTLENACGVTASTGGTTHWNRFWLVGDSVPLAWRHKLKGALDPRHPTRHSIWTPVWDAMQHAFFVHKGRRLNSTAFWVINAVESPTIKPSPSARVWDRLSALSKRQEDIRIKLSASQPLIVITLGQFAFEFIRRAAGMPAERVDHWSKSRLAFEFHKATAETKEPMRTPLIVPLLHATISRGQFLDAHRAYTCNEEGNYFEMAGTRIAAVIIRLPHLPDIWMAPPLE